MQTDTRLIVNGDTVVFPNDVDKQKQNLYSSGVGSSITLTATTTLAENDVYNIDS